MDMHEIARRYGGLTDRQAASAREKHGANTISRKKTKGFWRHLLENFGDPVIKILLVALGVNFLFVFRGSEWYETAGIAAAVLTAVLISTLSERGSESAFKRLQAEASGIRCRVIRDGGLTELPIGEVVVGDLVSLQAGDRVPADGVLVYGQTDVDQSVLNGETREAVKTAGDGGANGREARLTDPHRLFRGTVVCAGRGVMRATAIGDNTFYGKLAGEVQEETVESPLKTRLGALAGTISRFGYAGAGLVAFAYLFNVFVFDNRFDPARILAALAQPARVLEHLLHAVTLAVTVIVVAVPEGLPMMITVVLSSNMKRMLKDNVLVRKLVGIETAGSLNILFTDKTGTLTRGRLQVTGFIDGAGEVWKSAGRLKNTALWRELHRAVAYNSMAEMSNGAAVGGNPTDRALLSYVSAHPVAHKLARGGSVPFDSARKYMASGVTGEWDGVLVKGAPELLLPRCTEYTAADGRSLPFWPAALTGPMEEAQNNAARLVAVAVSEGGRLSENGGLPEKLRLIGVAAVRDDVRREAAEGIRQIRRAGIQAVMITGDAKATAQAIARRVGLPGGGHVLTSDELSRLDDAQVAQILPDLCVVARAMPRDKSRLVRIAQGMGLVAGMTGDGVNDAPALRRADVGFAMGSGAEVAKEAGDIVILDDNLLSIAKAVRYGRTIFKSIRKFIIFQLTLNFCAMGVSVLAPIIGVDSPITVIQMLWINMVMDTLAGLAFGGEQALLEYMDEPPKERGEPIINAYMWREITLGGLYAVLMCLWFLKSPATTAMFGVQTRFLTAFFALFMFTGIFSSFCARTHHVNLFDHLAGNKPFLAIMGLVAVTQVFLIYFGGTLFRTSGLAVNELVFVLLLSSTAVLAHILRAAWYEWRGLPAGT